MKSKNISTCRLCLKRRKLCHSHIFSEFFYEPMYYEEKYRLISVSANPKERDELEQKGLREHLLCKCCENQLSKYETYAKEIFFGSTRNNVPTVLGESSHYELIGNVDYKSFKLFQVSLLWRAGIASRKEFSRVSLGKHHEEKLRVMIKQENPGKPHEYGCLLIAALHKGGLMDMVSSPVKIAIDGHVCYRFMLGGFSWLYVVSSHSAQFSHEKYFLQADGKLMFLKEEARNMKFLTEDERWNRLTQAQR